MEEVWIGRRGTRAPRSGRRDSSSSARRHVVETKWAHRTERRPGLCRPSTSIRWFALRKWLRSGLFQLPRRDPAGGNGRHEARLDDRGKPSLVLTTPAIPRSKVRSKRAPKRPDRLPRSARPAVSVFSPAAAQARRLGSRPDRGLPRQRFRARRGRHGCRCRRGTEPRRPASPTRSRRPSRPEPARST